MCIVLVDPIIPLLHPVRGPFSFDVTGGCNGIGQALVVTTSGLPPRSVDDLCCPFATGIFVFPEGHSKVITIRVYASREDQAIFHRHVRALPERRAHGMARVPEQSDTADSPLRDRFAS